MGYFSPAHLLDKFTPLDVSPCRALERLDISIQLRKPGRLIESILPSVTSSQFSHIFLHLEDEFEAARGSGTDYIAWSAIEDHLLWLSKRFSAENPGKKVKVDISAEAWGEFPGRMEYFLERINCDRFFPRLRKEEGFPLRWRT